MTRKAEDRNNGNVANLTLRSGLEGSRSIVFVDRKARKRAEFGINQDGRPNLRLFDEKGNRTWEA